MWDYTKYAGYKGPGRKRKYKTNKRHEKQARKKFDAFIVLDQNGETHFEFENKFTIRNFKDG
ncbi:hypothetical protein LWM68_15055 [Niabella sp. W65]|nr:hypothetical protein [Niabella sp. W65]MCH7363961.1 hypothetical protein [Niabella sp. W65]